MRTARILDLAGLVFWALCIVGCHRNVVTTSPQLGGHNPCYRHVLKHSLEVLFGGLNSHFYHSYRSATIGCTLIARRAGM
jgi:hypothetical protein